MCSSKELCRKTACIIIKIILIYKQILTQTLIIPNSSSIKTKHHSVQGRPGGQGGPGSGQQTPLILFMVLIYEFFMDQVNSNKNFEKSEMLFGHLVNSEHW